MKCYSQERKQSVLKKMMPPLNTPVSQLVTETGISDCALYTWRKEASAEIGENEKEVKKLSNHNDQYRQLRISPPTASSAAL